MKKIDTNKLEWLRVKRLKKHLKRLKKNRPSSRSIDYINEFKQRRIPAPKVFSFIDNTNEMLRYFGTGKTLIDKKIPIRFDLGKITTLTSDGIAIFASIFTDKNYHNGTNISGTPPRDIELKRKFLGSGFYEHVDSKRKPTTSCHSYLLHKISNKKVEPSIAKKATDFAAEYTFKDGRIFRPVYEIIIELMANTNNHAGTTTGLYDWWLYVFYDKTTNITSYSFLDFGVGIFNSKQFIIYKNFIFIQTNRKQTTLEMASDLLDGKISSKTGKGERGRGFTCIMNNAKNPSINKFIIISNNAKIDIKNRTSEELAEEFLGTFAYWEISNEN